MVTDLEPPQTGFTISMFLIEKKPTGNFVSTTKALTQKSRIAKLTLTGVSASCNPRHISWDIYLFLRLSQLAIINIELGRRVKKKKLRRYSGEVSQFITSGVEIIAMVIW